MHALSRPTLTIDLLAIVENYRRLIAQVKPAEVAAVVKADGYGLGAKPIALALSAAGCKTFFVAHVEEGAALRHTIPDATIFVLHGYDAAHRALFAEHKLAPVISSKPQLIDWLKAGLRTQHGLHLDTGMSRLGLSEADLTLVEGAATPSLVMSHLASADDPEHAKNEEQLTRFRALTNRFSNTRFSLAASGGCFLGASFASTWCDRALPFTAGTPGNRAKTRCAAR